jgi:hypothetical protein
VSLRAHARASPGDVVPVGSVPKNENEKAAFLPADAIPLQETRLNAEKLLTS